MAGLSEIIQELRVSRGLTNELVRLVIENFLKAAYKKHFGSDTNAVIDFSDDDSDVTLYSKKIIVKEVKDPVVEMSWEKACELEPECELGDQLLLEVQPSEFDRNATLVATQRMRDQLRELEGDTLFSEFKNKLGEVVIGYCIRENDKNIIVDLGRTEGILPKRFQSPNEVYRQGDKIKALVQDVRKNGFRLDVVLSRSHPEFVKKIFELEVPELYDETVEIVKIVREPGYRTKIAVRSLHSEIDPIGTCVGTRGIRINNVMLELDGERIDVLRYDADPLRFIHNALSPVEVRQVVVSDYAKKVAIVIVNDDMLSMAIGKLGLNVKLANRLTDWSINVKTVTQFREMEGSNELFKTFEGTLNDTEEVDITKIVELTTLRIEVLKKLRDKDIEYIEDLISMTDKQLEDIGISSDEITHIHQVISESVQVEEDAINKDGYETSPVRDGQEQEERSPASFSTQSPPVLDSQKDENEEEYEDIESGIEVLPIPDEIVTKLLHANITKLYDLVEIYSNDKLNTIEVLTEEERTELGKIITENIQYEE